MLREWNIQREREREDGGGGKRRNMERRGRGSEHRGKQIVRQEERGIEERDRERMIE